MGTTTALELNKRLSQAVGDYMQVAVSTNIAANNLITSNTFWEYDNGQNRFESFYAYIVSKNNEDKERKIRNYYTANATCNVFGSALSSDTNVADVRIGRFKYFDKQDAINIALFETYPDLFKEVDDRASITCNSSLFEYALPTWAAQGVVRQVLTNTSAYTADEDEWDRVWNWSIVNAGASIRLPALWSTGTKVRLKGITPLETIAGPSNAVNIDGRQVDLLVTYAKYKLYQTMDDPVASEDTNRYKLASEEAYREYIRLLPSLGMHPPATTLKWGGI